MIPLATIAKGQAIIAALEGADLEGPLVEFVLDDGPTTVRFIWDSTVDGWVAELAS